MKKVLIFLLVLIFVTIFVGCSPAGDSQQKDQQNQKIGVLQFKANGEDFVREGFTSKDGWDIAFDNVFITLGSISAFQANPPYDADKGGTIQAEVKLNLPGTYLIDLAGGGDDADSILVEEVQDALVGHYNALSWEMIRAAEGTNKGYSLVMIGKAEKEGEVIDFTIGIENQYRFSGGDFVGDERKGIVEEGGMADVEMTFHFDHIFGDGGAPADDEINTGSLGFDSFAALAEGGKVDVNLTELKELDAASYERITEILLSLGHVGEGHCYSEEL